MKKFFFRKHAQAARKATAGERKAREIMLLEVDRRFGCGPSEERILACAVDQLRMVLADMFWG